MRQTMAFIGRQRPGDIGRDDLWQGHEMSKSCKHAPRPDVAA
jgi:hypothetical protein